MLRTQLRLSLLALPAAGLLLAACGAPADGGAAAPGAPATGAATTSASCAKADLQLTTPGTLTLGTDKPAYPPWFVDDDPSNGKGYESAVGYAIAQQLGFTKEEVTWVDVPFNTAIAPAPRASTST